ncbi:MAG: hypothetical protein C4562_01370 [Actinobacteria bacterium]|nr:MAG: hypothetical protein C4562_01370 [Actinomycetota bacterium]
MNNLKIEINPKKIAIFLVIIALFLTIQSVTAQYLLHVLKYNHLIEYIRLVNLDSEANIPTWFAVILLLCCSTLLFLIGVSARKNGNKDSVYWKGLALLFLYISIDEASRIHELSIKPLRHLFNVSGYLYFTWVIPGLILVIVIVLLYLKFFVNLPQKICNLIAGAWGLYVGGALGMEAIGARYISHVGSVDMLFVMITTIEETLEMLGLILFIYALLIYLSSLGQNTYFAIKEK